MFRKMRLDARLKVSSIVSATSIIGLSSLAVFSLWRDANVVDHQVMLTEATRHGVLVDMMHDGIKANAMYGLYIGAEASAAEKQELHDKMLEDIASFREHLQIVRDADLAPIIETSIQAVLPHVDPYTDNAVKILETAATDPDAAQAFIPEFLDSFDALEIVLGTFGEELSHLAVTSEIEAKREAQIVLLVNVAFAAVMILVTMVNSRRVKLNVSRPIERLRAALKQVRDGDLEMRIGKVMRDDEFGDIARDIDAVSGRLLQAMADQEDQRREGEASMARLQQGLQRLANGDLGDRIETPFIETYEPLRSHYNETVDRLNELVSQVVAASRTIRKQSNQISEDSQDLSRRTESQAATLEQTAAALEQMTASVKLSAENARKIEGAVDAARGDVERSGEVVRGAVGAMGAIADSSQKISQIIGVIDDIAFQTGLLALNAGVEAARAGEVGRGFAVVASEVRVLANRASDAASEIKALIDDSARYVSEGVDRVNSTGEALTGVIGHVANISELMSGISNEANEQAQGINEVNIGVGQLDQVTQENVTMVETSNVAIQSMNREAIGLANLVGQFKLRGQESAADAEWEAVERGSGTPQKKRA
ncbi:methyl-accepting chemotaxis protein [Arenibacterium sp. LLYu02]|uniref:methyl-accepting chemotaxis protein n=1 Tax=Arenibacterium sp. LLYu02 TaxID=3404132 RepID=UPI003B20BC30